MLLFSRVISLLLSLSFFARASDVDFLESIEDDEDVLVLTADNFEEVIKASDTMLVEFYSPNCGHCKAAAPEYAKAATELRNRDPPVFIGKVDATIHTKLAEKYEVKGYPTFKFFKNSLDNPKDYNSERKADNFVQFVDKYSGPLVTIVASEEEFKLITEANKVVLFSALQTEEKEKLELLETLASAEDDVVFVTSSNHQVSKQCDALKCVVIHKQFDEGVVVYDGKFEEEALKKFIVAHKRPLIVEFSDETAPAIFGGSITTHVLAFVDYKADYYPNLKEKLTESAKHLRDQVIHVVVDYQEKRLVEFFGFTDSDFPAIILLSVEGSLKKYYFHYRAQDLLAKVESDLVSDLIAFQDDFFAGKLKPQLKSAEPEDDSNLHVKIIVGKQFMERVIETDKDVLLEFYAPWCGHCKSLAPIYESLAEKFASVDSIMIAKMDATANEIEYSDIDIKGFPTIIFFPGANKEKYVLYEGGRDEAGLTKFLKENARKFELEGESFGVDHDEL